MVVRVFFLDLSHDAWRPTAWLAVLDDLELARREKFVREADRERYTAAHVGLRLLLADQLHRAPDDLRFGRHACPVCGGPHGKPFLLGDHGLHWSLSRSAGIVAFALSALDVGIDLEQRVAGGLEPLLGALHPRERTALARVAADRREDAFTQCWTRKEAYLKGTGRGLAESPARCFVGLGEQYGESRARLRDWWLGDLEPPAGHACALAVRCPGTPMVVSSAFPTRVAQTVPPAPPPRVLGA